MLGERRSDSEEGETPADQEPAVGVTTGEVLPRIHGYELQRQIGRGGSATVYLAREIKHDRLVALKVLHPALAASLQAERFLREISIIAKLAHPNILPLLDSGSVAGQLYYVTPYVPGESLRRRLEREQRLSVDVAVRLTREVAEALDYAHRQGLVHRDVKPENILLADGHALVADFGIARALSLAADERLTTPDIAVGTPRYMSPEQAKASGPVDGRSDTYSLGCVLFELLSGRPPYDGDTPQEIIAQHFEAPIPSLRSVSPAVPASIERSLRTALAKRAEDRFRSAAVFADAIAGRSQDLGPEALNARLRQGFLRHRVPALVLAGVIGVAAVVRWVDTRASSRSGGLSTLDTTRLAVFPVTLDDRSGATAPTGEDLLSEAISRWEGVALVDQFQVRDAFARLEGAVTVSSTAQLAAILGAGRYVLVQTTAIGDSSRAYATLYETRGARPLATASEVVPNGATEATAAFARIAQRLLLRGRTVDSTLLAGASRHLPAVQAFSSAQDAVARWDLAAADSSFQSALGFDSRYVRASYWLAQVRAWRGLPSDEWVSLAERAANSAETLSDRERNLAMALVHLGESRFRQACGFYSALRDANAQDFAAWYGLGQCHSRDRTVVRDTRSPSEWRMRSSYFAAVSAYDRALELLPSAYEGYEHDAFEGLRALLMVGTRVIPARGEGADSGQFVARLARLDDTLALVPYRWEIVTGGGGIPPGHREALSDRLLRFRRLAGVWSAAFPQRGGPKHAVAIAMEMSGDRRAIDTLLLARRLTADTVRRMQLAAAEALLRIKFADFQILRDVAAIRHLSDTLLRAWPSVADASDLTPIAALSGQCDRAEELTRRKRIVTSAPLPIALIAAADAHLARTSLGCEPGRSGVGLRDLVALVDREAALLPEDSRKLLDVVALHRPALVSSTFDSSLVQRLARHSEDPLILAAAALAEKDTARAKDQLSRFLALKSPSQVPPSPDVSVAAARLLLAVRDSGAAVAILDSTLDGIRSFNESQLEDPVIVGSMVRGMVLRADIGAAMGDNALARRWAGAVSILWAQADAELQSTVRRMSDYSRFR